MFKSHWMRILRVLGIETSCDETGVAIYDSERGLLAHTLYSQVKLHADYGGVVPELASRDHVRKILPLLDDVFAQAGVNKKQLNEILLSMKIESELSKEKILELYLNKIFLGHRSYGIAAASQVYYDKSLADLSLAQAAMIAGLPKAPSKYNPITNPERALSRRDHILHRMQINPWQMIAAAARFAVEWLMHIPVEYDG